MKHSSPAALVALGLLSVSLTLSAQQGIQKPEPPPAPAADPAAQAPAQPGQPAQPGADPAAAEPQPVLDLDPNYVLGTDDSIMVHVWKEPTISGPLIIRPDGRVTLPLVGDLPAAGLTPMALAAEITDGLKKFINDPSVTVTVTATNSRKVFFIGEIAHPGAVLMTRNMTVLQAIASAGGLTPYANKHKLYILRGPKGNQQRIPFDYTKALKQGNQQGVSLVAGDTIVVQ